MFRQHAAVHLSTVNFLKDTKFNQLCHPLIDEGQLLKTNDSFLFLHHLFHFKLFLSFQTSHVK